jgi:hypothetical protein
MNNEKLDSKKLEILQEQLKVHKAQDRRAGMLLNFAMVLTGLLYFMFEKHLFLGDAITWGAYFHEWHSALDFLLMFVIVVMSAVFLAWVKHHAYLHFGLYGSIGLIVFTVIGFALFAEFFSSSASQDTKSRVLLENDKAYQSTLAPVAASAPALASTGNAEAIAKAEQNLARCKANLGKPGYKHCNGDQARLDSLKASDAQALALARQVAADTQQMQYDRQDKLKADSYNAVIVSIAKGLGSATGTDYKDNIKTATVITMLLVAVAFEILHHFLSHAKERAQNAVYGLELELAKYQGQPLPEKPESVIPQNDGAFQQTGVGFTAPIGKQPTAHYSPTPADHDKPVFKYQREQPEPPKARFAGFVDTNGKQPAAQPEAPAQPEIMQAEGFRQSPEQRATVDRLHREQMDAYRAGKTYREELRGGSQHFRDVPLDRPTPARPSNQKAGATGLQNPALGSAEDHYPLPLQQRETAATETRGSPCTVHADGNAEIRDSQSAETRDSPCTVHADGNAETRDSQGAETRDSPCTVHAEEGQGKPFTDDLYHTLKAMIQSREVEPTFRPVKAVLRGWQVGASDRNRQIIAAAALDRMHRENILTLNPANDGTGIKKAKYILA